MTDTTTEPAIPVLAPERPPRIAPVHIDSLIELLTTTKRDWPPVTQDGAQVALKVDARGVAVVATISVHDWSSEVLATRTFDGQWEVGGLIRWSPRQ